MAQATCRLRTLAGTAFEDIHRCFREAFADYFLDTGSMAEPTLRHRAVKNGFDADLSVGGFANGQLVAFTLIGTGKWHGERAAFDIATGIAPRYRGQGLAARMFAAASEELRRHDIGLCLLEVLEQNAAAISAYRKAGFRETRRFDCYRRLPHPPAAPGVAAVEIRRLDRSAAAALAAHRDFEASWENSLAAIGRVQDSLVCFGAFEAGRCVGELSYCPRLGWLLSLTVDRRHRRGGIGRALLGQIAAETPGALVKANNVERGYAPMAQCLSRAGFELFAAQLEMQARLG